MTLRGSVRLPRRRTSRGADRRGRAGRGDPQALLHRRDVVRLDQPGGARDPRDRHEPAGRQVQHRGGRRGPGPLRPDGQRRLEAVRRQAGRERPLRRDERVPRQRRRHPDQDGAGGQARRGRPAAGAQGLPVGGADPALDAGRRPHLAAAAPRHLLDRGPRPAHPRPQERQPPRAHPREARLRGRRRHRRGRRRRRRTPTSSSISGHDGGTGASPLTSLKHAGAPVGARAGRDPADPAAQRSARPHRRPDRRPAEDRPRRRHRRPARARRSTASPRRRSW